MNRKFKKNHKNRTFHEVKQMRVEVKITLWNKCFSLIHIGHK